MKKMIVLTLLLLISTIAKADDIDEDFNAIKFAYEMFLMDDYDKIIEIAHENEFVEKGKKSQTNFFATRKKGRSPVINMSRWRKKSTKLYLIEIYVNKWTDKEIVDCLNDLGFKESAIEKRLLVDTPVENRVFVNKMGTQRIDFEIYYGVDIVKKVLFKWTSKSRDKGTSDGQYAVKKDNNQEGLQSVGLDPGNSNESVSEVNNSVQVGEGGQTLGERGTNMSDSESSPSASVGIPWKKPERKFFLDNEYQRVANYNSSFSSLHTPSSYGAKLVCLDEDLKRNGLVDYISQHPLGYLPNLIDDYIIPLWTSCRYGDNYWKGRKKTTEKYYNDNKKMTERLNARIAAEFKKTALLVGVNSYAAPHTGIKVQRNFVMTGIDNYEGSKWGDNDNVYVDVIFSGKIDKIPDDLNVFTYGFILTIDCKNMLCVSNIWRLTGSYQDSMIKLENYDSNNYNVSFRVRLDYKSAYVLNYLTNIMLVKTDSDIWKKALNNSNILVEAYDNALKRAKDEKYKEYSRGQR